MFGVTVRFLSALLGSLATFFLVAHAAHLGGLIGAHSIYRVDEFYTLALRPITTMEAATRNTLYVLMAALVVQGLAIGALFGRWSRPAAAKPLPVERVSSQQFERLGVDADRHRESQFAAFAVATADRFKAQDFKAYDASAYDDFAVDTAPAAIPAVAATVTAGIAGASDDLLTAMREMPSRFRLIRAGETV
jgi:hypothetical protein